MEKIKDLNERELIEIEGGLAITLALAIACGATFITGMGVGVAMYAATR